MANPVNNLAIVQDQFQLMAMAVEIEDENKARFNNNLVAMFNEMKKSINTLSDRILVFEQEREIYKENVEILTKSHLEKEEAQANKIAQLTLRLDEVAQKNKDLENRLENHKHIKAHDVPIVVGYNEPFKYHKEPIYQYDPSYTEGPTFPENK